MNPEFDYAVEVKRPWHHVWTTSMCWCLPRLVWADAVILVHNHYRRDRIEP